MTLMVMKVTVTMMMMIMSRMMMHACLAIFFIQRHGGKVSRMMMTPEARRLGVLGWVSGVGWLGWVGCWVVRWFGVVWWRVGLGGWVAGRGWVVSVVV